MVTITLKKMSPNDFCRNQNVTKMGKLVVKGLRNKQKTIIKHGIH